MRGSRPRAWTTSRSSTAERTARSASSSVATGIPNTAITASPTNSRRCRRGARARPGPRRTPIHQPAQRLGIRPLPDRRRPRQIAEEHRDHLAHLAHRPGRERSATRRAEPEVVRALAPTPCAHRHAPSLRPVEERLTISERDSLACRAARPFPRSSWREQRRSSPVATDCSSSWVARRDGCRRRTSGSSADVAPRSSTRGSPRTRAARAVRARGVRPGAARASERRPPLRRPRERRPDRPRHGAASTGGARHADRGTHARLGRRPALLRACRGRPGPRPPAGSRPPRPDPANVLVEHGTGRIVVTDFGLARLARSSRSAPISGVLAGTPEYWAPEQAAGGAIGPATDLYALGCILFRLLTGRMPFEGEDRPRPACDAPTSPRPPWAVAAPGIQAEAAQLVDRLLQRAPALRGDAVEAALTLGATRRRSPARGSRRWTQVLIQHRRRLPPSSRVLREPATIVRRARSHRSVRVGASPRQPRLAVAVAAGRRRRIRDRRGRSHRRQRA